MLWSAVITFWLKSLIPWLLYLLATENLSFELAYWHWGLTIAQKWKERLGENRYPACEEVRNKLHSPYSDG